MITDFRELSISVASGYRRGPDGEGGAVEGVLGTAGSASGMSIIESMESAKGGATTDAPGPFFLIGES